LKRKNKKRFFSFQSMPNLNFAEIIYIASIASAESGPLNYLRIITLLDAIASSDVFYCHPEPFAALKGKLREGSGL